MLGLQCSTTGYINAGEVNHKPVYSKMPIITSSPDDDTNAAGQLRIIANLKDEINKLKGDAPTRVS